MHSWKEESQDTLLKPLSSRISCNIIVTESALINTTDYGGLI